MRTPRRFSPISPLEPVHDETFAEGSTTWRLCVVKQGLITAFYVRDQKAVTSTIDFDVVLSANDLIQLEKELRMTRATLLEAIIHEIKVFVQQNTLPGWLQGYVITPPAL